MKTLRKIKHYIGLKKVWLTAAVFLFALLLVGLFTGFNVRLYHDSRVALTPNQACVGIKVATARGMQVSRITQRHKTAYYKDPQQRTASFVCDTNQNSRQLSRGQQVAGVDSRGYDFGAQVTYFANTTAAQAFAEHTVNPQRYWSVSGPSNIPQTSTFTSYVGNSGSNLYFDAYTVRGDALVRISLPCTFPETNPGTGTYDKCMNINAPVSQSMAAQIVDAFANSVKQLHY